MFKRILIIIVLILLVLVSGCNAVAEPPQAEPPEGQEEEQRKSETSEAEEDGNAEDANANYVTIKYRNTPVNIAAPQFEYLNTDVSSFIRGAWYDEDNQYLVMKLNDTYYNYCSVPVSTWEGFKHSESFGRYFNEMIKEQFEYKVCEGPQY